MIMVKVICSNKARNTSIPFIVKSLLAPVPTLHNDCSQQVVQADNFVRSPITIHPGSHLLVQFLSSDQVSGLDVESSVLVVYENRFTMQVLLSPVHLCSKAL